MKEEVKVKTYDKTLLEDNSDVTRHCQKICVTHG